jgi:hypothetical protein
MDIQKLYDSLDVDEKQLLEKILAKQMFLNSKLKALSKDKTFADTAQSFAWAMNGAKIGMSIRLFHVLISMREMPLSIIEKKDITSTRNAGMKCWQEFEKLRENYYKNLKIK